MSDHDPIQQLWKSQKQEDFSMSLAEVHARADRFQSRIKRRNWIEYAAGALMLAMFGAMTLLFPDPFVKTGSALIVAGALYVMWKLATMARPASDSEREAAQSVFDFHRAELVRQRDALRGIWNWYLGPFIPGVVAFIGGVAFTPDNPAPLAGKLALAAISLGFVAAIFGVIAWINHVAAKRLDAEIEALDRAQAG